VQGRLAKGGDTNKNFIGESAVLIWCEPFSLGEVGFLWGEYLDQKDVAGGWQGLHKEEELLNLLHQTLLGRSKWRG